MIQCSSLFGQKYKDCIKTITEISKSETSKESLVCSNKKMFNFDYMIEKGYKDEINKPTSVDAVIEKDNIIVFTEFKGGFDKVVDIRNIDKTKMVCENTNEYCNEMGGLWVKYNKTYEDKLKINLKLKAIESYIELMRILDEINEIDNEYNLKLFLVIDAPNDQEEDILNEVAKNPQNITNTISSIKNSMKRLKKTQYRNYYYDDIDVCSSKDFSKLLEDEKKFFKI